MLDNCPRNFVERFPYTLFWLNYPGTLQLITMDYEDLLLDSMIHRYKGA